MQKVGSPKSACGPPKRVFWRFWGQLWSVDLEAARTQYTIYNWCRIWRFGQEKAIYNIQFLYIAHPSPAIYVVYRIYQSYHISSIWSIY